jgi:hypothetical protein
VSFDSKSDKELEDAVTKSNKIVDDLFASDNVEFKQFLVDMLEFVKDEMIQRGFLRKEELEA